MRNPVIKSAIEQKPFNYMGGHPSYPQPSKGIQPILCVLDDGLTLVETSILFRPEKVLLHIPREQIREIRDIDRSTSLDQKFFIDVVVELDGATYTAKFQASGMRPVVDGMRLAMAAQRLTFPRN